jgi:ABC-2 type transport system ATP-binding protein
MTFAPAEATNGREVCIEVKDLVKSYKRGQIKALAGIDLKIYKGEVFGLIGPNGAGKTTLLGCLLGLLEDDSGSVTVCGRPPGYLSVRRVTGYMPERSEFETWMTGCQFLQYHHMLAGRDSATRDTDIDEVLELVEIDRTAWKRRLGTYSRGMLQRLNLAQALLGKPTVLLLDEPTLGLDPPGVAIVRRVVMKLKEGDYTAIINSHQLDEIERVCDRVAFITGGKIRSVENLKVEKSGEYPLLVKWLPECAGNGTAEKVLSCASRAGCSVKELGDVWCRFVIADANTASNLIKELVQSGLPVQEAVSERSRLEELFEAGKRGAANE